MNWKYKAHALAALSRVPGGRSLYHGLQRVAGTNRLQLDRDLERAFELVDLIFEADGEIEGKQVFEIGTGWRPFVPFVMALAGAKRVITVDVNPWLTSAYACETWRALESRLPEIAARCRVPEQEIVQRYRSVPSTACTLESVFVPLRIQYDCPADARDTQLPARSMDIILSSNVLEHIPADVQRDIHKESFRLLKTGGLSAHRFNPQDHYSTIDSKITNGNFLQFSEKQWRWYGGTGLAYHNRLRSPEYRELFQQAGFEITVFRERTDQRTLDAIRSGALTVDECFSRFTPEELAVDYIWMANRKAAPVPARSEIESSLPAFTN